MIMKGSYLLIILSDQDKKIKIGKLGIVFFKKGYYIYVGSALNGIEQRVNRHLRKNKKIFWHIDYLLKQAKIINVYYKESNQRQECIIAGYFTDLKSIIGFGCSDCKCKSHLFYTNDKNILIQKLKTLKVYPIS